MIKNYLYLFKETYKKSNKLYNCKNSPISYYVMAITSYLVTPFFLYLKITANSITGLNFFLAIISIFLIFTAEQSLYFYGVLLFLIVRVFDFCDGNVARLKNESTFYGRFIDAIVDIFHESFLILSIHFFCYKIYFNETLFLLGLISSLFFVFGCCIADKYSSLVRWSNEENKKKIKPYLGKKLYVRASYTLYDFYWITIMISPFFIYNEKNFILLMYVFTSLTFIMSITNILKYTFYAGKYLRFKAKDK